MSEYLEPLARHLRTVLPDHYVIRTGIDTIYVSLAAMHNPLYFKVMALDRLTLEHRLYNYGPMQIEAVTFDTIQRRWEDPNAIQDIVDKIIEIGEPVLNVILQHEAKQRAADHEKQFAAQKPALPLRHRPEYE